MDELELAGIRGTSDDDPSGARRAQEAHDAGAVVPPVEVPTFDVLLEFRVHGSDDAVNELAAATAENLALHPLVTGAVTYTTARRGTT